MTNETEKKNNAHRLANALYCISEDTYRINAMAHTLNYDAKQLRTDLIDLYKHLSDLERKETE
mgnify:CR=1 FL=1